MHLRDRDLPRLAAAGPLGDLMARQAAAYRDDRRKRALGRAHAGLPDDLANFHHDPLAAAVAAGWDGVTIERHLPAHGASASTVGWSGPGRTTPVPGAVELVVGVDGPAFAAHWLDTVTTLPRK